MRKTGTIVIAIVLAAVLILSGCAVQTGDDYSQLVVATYGDQNIYLDEANFKIRGTQYMYEMIYSSYTTDLWGTDLGDGSGKNYEDMVKEDTMAEILQTYVLMSYADEYNVSLTDADKEKVQEAVTSYMDSTDENVLKVGRATEELVTKVYENNALANKVWQAMVADVDTEVSDEEAAQISVSYVNIPEDDETYTDPEATANKILKKVKKGTALSDVVSDYDGLSVSTGQYDKYESTDTEDDSDDSDEDSTDAVTEGLTTEARKLATGESSVFQIDGNGWYVLYCDSDFDEDATEEQKESIIDTRKSDKFNELYESLDKKKFTVDDDVWAKVSLENTPAYVAETTAAETTEDGTTIEAASASAEEDTTAASVAEEDTTAATQTSEASTTEAAASTSAAN
jgi:foldase protein PrsA